MKIVFDQVDIEKILIEHANKTGVQCNAIDIECQYGEIRRATAFFSNDVKIRKDEDMMSKLGKEWYAASGGKA